MAGFLLHKAVNSGDRYKKLKSGKRSTGIGLFVFFLLFACQAGIAATVSTHTLAPHKKTSQKISESQHARRRMHHLAHAHNALTSPDHLAGQDAKSMAKGLK